MRHIQAIFLIIACAVGLVPRASHAQTALLPVAAQDSVSRADLIRLLGRLHEDEAVRADLTSLGFTGERLELATQHAADMLRDPVIAGYVADRVLALRAGEIVPMAQAQGLLWGVIDQGLGHLPLRDLRYYYLVEQAVLGGMPADICGRAVRGLLPPTRMAEVTARAAARLNVEGLRNYYRIQLRAAQLGASRGPVRLSPERAAKAEASIFAALTRHIATMPDAAKIERSFTRLDKASNRDACRAGKIFIEAVLTLEGRELHDALIQLSMP